MDIIELAKQAEFTDLDIAIAHDNFARFAELVAAAARADVREACAKFFDDNDINLFWGSQVARHIRERGTT